MLSINQSRPAQCPVVGDRALDCVAARISERSPCREQGAMAIWHRRARAPEAGAVTPPRRPGRVTLKQRRNGHRRAPRSRLAGSCIAGQRATQAFSVWFASPRPLQV